MRWVFRKCRLLVWYIKNFTIRVLKFVSHDDDDDYDDDIIPGYDLCSQSDSGSVVNQYQLLLLDGGSSDGGCSHPKARTSINPDLGCAE